MPRRRGRGALPLHSQFKTLGLSLKAGEIDLERACAITHTLSFLISVVIIHPIHPSIIARACIRHAYMVFFSLITHNFHLQIPLCPTKISFYPILFCIHPLTQPYTRLFVCSAHVQKRILFSTNDIHIFVLTCANADQMGAANSAETKKKYLAENVIPR